MRTLARRQATIRFTAIGGVNCPSAIFIVSSTPNHTGSHWNASINGYSSGRKIRKIDTPSRNMPMTVIATNSSSNVPIEPRFRPLIAATTGSASPSVLTT